jgi:DNA topoisomerase II
VLLDNLELDLLKLDNKVRFILGVVNGEIIVNNRKRAELFMELHQKGFTPFPKKGKGPDVSVAGAAGDDEEESQSPDAEVAVKGGVKASDYEYLLSMAIGTLTLEKVREMCAEKDKLDNAVAELRKASPRSLWEKDLDALEKELDVSSICFAHSSLYRFSFYSPIHLRFFLVIFKSTNLHPYSSTKNVDNFSFEQELDRKDADAERVRNTMREKNMANNTGTSRRPQPKKTAGT